MSLISPKQNKKETGSKKQTESSKKTLFFVLKTICKNWHRKLLPIIIIFIHYK